MTESVIVVREPGRAPLRLLVSEPLEVGRDCAGLLLTDPQISRRHLELRANGGHVAVTDLGSTNGSTIDGQSFSGSVALEPGSIVKIGDTTIELYTDARSTLIAATRPVETDTDFRRTSIDIVAEAVIQDRPDLGVSTTDRGTLTIVFSDIESSTQRVEQLGDEKWFDLLSIHNDMVRRRLALHRGTEVKAQGDGFMLTFGSARAAVRCMSDVQRDLFEHGVREPEDQIRIRVGIHTGEVISGDDGDLFGRHVNLAARVANEASGGEILVSSLVREIIDSRGDMVFGEPRVAELKGLAGPYTLYPILWE